MEGAIDTLLILVVLSGLYMLATSDLVAAIRATALQGLVLALLPLLVRGHVDLHGAALGAGTLALKVFAIPTLLRAALRRAGVNREVEPLLGFGASLSLAGVLVVLSIALGQRLAVPGAPPSSLLVPCAFATVLIGLLILVGRTKALTQVLGYLVLENGIFLFGLAVLRAMPLIVELGVLLDILVAVFVMGIVMHKIRRTFDHIDTHAMTELRD